MLSYQPWIGDHYNTTRLLLLGESAYSWEGEDGRQIDPSSDHAINLVNEVLDAKSTVPLMTKVSRAITGTSDPTLDLRRLAWNRVAFANFVPGSVGLGARRAPAPAMWQRAREEFPSLLSLLKPKRIVVLGQRLWANMPETQHHVTDRVQGYDLGDGSVAICFAVKHPSAGLSWGELASIVHFACGHELLLGRP